MDPSRPPIPYPAYPGRKYSADAASSSTDGWYYPASNSTSAMYRPPPPPHPPHPRSNTSPSVFYPQTPAPRPPVPRRPPGRPKTAPDGPPPLPLSLVPGAGHGRPRVEGFSPHDSALFFQPRTPVTPHLSSYPTHGSPSSFSFSDPPPPVPALPPKPIAHASPQERLPHDLPSYSRPRLPPKIFAAPDPHTSDSPNVNLANDQQPYPFTIVEPRESISSPVESDVVLARVLAMSMQDRGPSRDERELDDKLLARALEESMVSFNSGGMHRNDPETIPSAASSPLNSTVDVTPELISASPSISASSSASAGFPMTPSTFVPTSENSEVKGRDAVNEDSTVVVREQEQERQRRAEARRKEQLELDERLARRLALEDSESSNTPKPPPSPSIVPTDAEASPATPVQHISHNARNNGSGLGEISTNDHPSDYPLPRYEDAVRGAQTSPLTPLSATSTPSPLTRGSASCIAAVGSMPRPLPSSNFPSPSSPHQGGLGTAPSLGNLGRSVSAQATIPSISEGGPRPVHGSTEDEFDPCHGHRPPLVPYNGRPNTVIPVQRAQIATASPGTAPRLAVNALTVQLAAGGSAGPSPIQEVADEESNGPPLNAKTGVDGVVTSVGNEPPLSSLDGPGSGTSSSPIRQAPIIEEELLLGVSFGFNPPLITLTPTLMQGPIPNVISLPYGKCPPVHIQAPSWKQLLKLLTRLSDSRIEPTVEAMAGTKAELKLRTVIQFVKVHHSSSEWRTIVYLTIDAPVPQQTSNAFKYTNGDVSTLPFSYTMSALPTLLRDGPDSSLAKYYTVPSTPSTPYPTLPMKLPNYAMYLQAVLEESRRAMNDSSSGLRRLGKMVDGFYPSNNQAEALGPEAAIPDRIRVGGFLRRALGRGDRNNNQQRGGNADTFEFITPFMIDEYR